MLFITTTTLSRTPAVSPPWATANFPAQNLLRNKSCDRVSFIGRKRARTWILVDLETVACTQSGSLRLKAARFWHIVNAPYLYRFYHRARVTPSWPSTQRLLVFVSFVAGLGSVAWSSKGQAQFTNKRQLGLNRGGRKGVAGRLYGSRAGTFKTKALWFRSYDLTAWTTHSNVQTVTYLYLTLLLLLLLLTDNLNCLKVKFSLQMIFVNQFERSSLNCNSMRSDRPL